MQFPTAAKIAGDPDDGVFVTIPSLDNGVRRHGPCLGYKSDFAGEDAVRGDDALVVEDNFGRLWILGWEHV